MWFIKHIIIGIFPSLIWFYLSGNVLSAILFFIASIAVDLDHPISMAILDRTINPSKIFDTFKEIQFKGLKKYEERLFCVFHTVEFIIVLAILSVYFNILVPILFGVVFHVILDAFTVARRKNKRIFFSTFFVLKYLKGEYKNVSK